MARPRRKVGSVAAALPDPGAARLALARILAEQVDDETLPPYVRASLARTLSALLDRLDVGGQSEVDVARRIVRGSGL